MTPRGPSLVGSAVAVAAGDPTPTPPPRIAVVARGDGTHFADALAVGSVAGQLGEPVFLASQTSLPADSAAALAAYNPELVLIPGGTAAISADVEAQIETATGLPSDMVVRAAGANRYETAGEIAAIFDELGIDANANVDYNFTIPPDHTPGTPLTVRVLAYTRTAPCHSALRKNSTFMTRAGVGRVGDGSDSLEVIDPGLRSFTEDRVPDEFLYTLDSTTGLAPGDAVHFGVFNGGPAATRCDLIITGAAVYYE